MPEDRLSNSHTKELLTKITLVKQFVLCRISVALCSYYIIKFYYYYFFIYGPINSTEFAWCVWSRESQRKLRPKQQQKLYILQQKNQVKFATHLMFSHIHIENNQNRFVIVPLDFNWKCPQKIYASKSNCVCAFSFHSITWIQVLFLIFISIFQFISLEFLNESFTNHWPKTTDTIFTNYQIVLHTTHEMCMAAHRKHRHLLFFFTLCVAFTYYYWKVKSVLLFLMEKRRNIKKY